MRISYTDSAQTELSRFMDRQKEIIEGIVRENKYVFGDDEIEITASDIKEASERIRALPSQFKKKSLLSEMVSKVYIMVGTVTATIGIAYPYLQSLMKDNPLQFMLVTIGISMMLLGYLMHFLFRSRRRSFERIVQLESEREELQTLEEAIRKIETDANHQTSEVNGK